MPTPVIIQVRVDSKQAVADVRELNKQVAAAFAGMRESVASLNGQMRELTFNPAGILRGTNQATHGIQAVHEAARLAVQGMKGLRSESVQSGEALDALGKQATGTNRKLTTLATGSGTLGTALGDMAKGAEAADSGLLSLEEGAATAQKSVSSLGRVTGNLLPRLEALSKTVFDPAGIETGAAAAVTALDRVKIAAAEVKASLRSGGMPVFVGGGGGRSGGSGGAAAGVGMTMLRGGGLLAEIMAAAGLGSAGYSSSFDLKAQKVKGNTQLTPAQREEMKAQILALMKSGSPVPEEQLFGAYMHAANYGRTGKRAEMLVSGAEAMSVATGAPADIQAQVVGGLAQKSAFNISDSKLKAFEEMLHVTAAGSDMELGEFSSHSTKSAAFSATYGLKPEQFGAAYSTMVQSKVPPAQSDTALAGLINQMAKPTPRMVKLAMGIQERTGTDLLPYFGVNGLKNNQLTGFLSALHSPGITKQDVANLFPATRGGLAATKLYDNADLFASKLNGPQGTATAMQGKVHNIDDLRREMLTQPGMAAQSELQKTKATAYMDGKPLQKDLADIIQLLGKAARAALDAATAFSALPKSVRQLIESVGAALIAVRLLGSPTGGLRIGLGGAEVGARGGLFSGLKGLFGGGAAMGAGAEAAEGVEGAGLAEGGAAAAGGAGIAAIAVPLAAVTAAVIAFGVAWKTNFAGIQQAFKPFLDDVKQTFGGVGKSISEFTTSALPTLKAFGTAIVPVFSVAFKVIGAVLKIAFDLIKGIIKTGLALVTGNWSGAWNNIKAMFVEIWGDIVQATKSIAPKFVAWLSNLGKELRRGAQNLGPEIKAGWDAAIAGLKQSFTSGARSLITSFSDGLINGMASMRSGIAIAAHSLGNLLPQHVQLALDSHSPSRVMHRIGQDAGQGFANGIRSKTGEVSSAARMIAEAATMGVSIKAPKAHKSDAERESQKEARHAKALAAQLARKVHTAGEFATTVGESPEEKELHRLDEARAKSLITAQQYADALARIQQKQADKARTHTLGTSLDTGEAQDRHYASKWQNKLTDNASYQKYLEDRKAQLADFQTTNKAWLDAHEAGAKRLQGIAGQIDKALLALANHVKANGLNQSLQDQLDAVAEDGPGKYARMKAHNDKTYQDALQVPGVNVTNALELWRSNNAAISGAMTDATNEAGDKKADWQYKTGEKDAAATLDYFTKRRDVLKSEGKDYTDEWYRISEYVLQIQSSITEGLKQAAEAERDSLRERFDALKESFQDGKANADDYKASLSALSAEIATFSAAHPDAAAALEPMRHDIADARTAKEMKRLAPRGSLAAPVGGTEFWHGLAAEAGNEGGNIVRALLNPKDRKNIGKQFWAWLGDTAENSLSSVISSSLQNALTGGATKGIGKDAFSGIQSIFQGAKGNLLAGAAGIYGAAAALGAMGKKKQKHSILGGILGGIAGSFFGQAGTGAEFGSALGGMFAGGGRPPLGIPSLVGERGPELFVPDIAGTIIPHHALAAHFMQQAGPQINLPFLPGTGASAAEPGRVSPGGRTSSRGDVDASITINQSGDHHYHTEMDVTRGMTDLARMLERARRGGVPATGS